MRESTIYYFCLRFALCKPVTDPFPTFGIMSNLLGNTTLSPAPNSGHAPVSFSSCLIYSKEKKHFMAIVKDNTCAQIRQAIDAKQIYGPEMDLPGYWIHGNNS